MVVSVSRLLGLDATVSAALVEEAERHIDQSHDLYQFTSQVNRAWSDTEKVRLLEALWRVAAADEAVHKYEEHLIRRVADLLHVPHSGFIKAKLRATERRGLDRVKCEGPLTSREPEKWGHSEFPVT